MHLPSHQRRKQVNDSFEHQTGKGEKVQAFEGQRQALVVAGKAAKTSKPGDGALDDPSFGKQDETTFGVGKFDDLQPNGLGCGVFDGLFTRVALVYKGNFDMPARHPLDLLGQFCNLVAVLLVSGGDMRRQQMA